MAADWAIIEAEYITGGTSYRKLADKYDIDQAIIARKAKKGDWVSKRQQYVSNISAKIVENDQQNRLNRAAAMSNAADLLLERTLAGIRAYKELPATAAKNYSDALKNIKEIHMIRSEEDIAEQQARIAKLQRETQKSSDEPIRIILQESLTEYSE